MADIKSAIRWDRAGIRAKPKRTQQGFVSIGGNLTRVGVLEYQRADGSIVREFRPPEEVLKPESIRSLETAPITDGHPEPWQTPDGKVSREVDPSNVSRLQKGVVKSAREDGDFVSGECIVQDADMIAMVDAGRRREISPGYRCDIELTSGEWNGQRYDQIQRNIIYNHVALLPKGAGRSGPMVALRVDSNEIVEDVAIERNDQMSKEDDSKEALAVIGTMQTKLDALEKELIATRALKDETKARLDEAKAELEEVKKIDHKALARERTSLITKASKYVKDVSKFDSLDDKAIMLETIKCKRPNLDVSAESDVYIRARFDALFDTEETEKVSDAIVDAVSRGDSKPAEDGYETNRKTMRDLWKQNAGKPSK